MSRRHRRGIAWRSLYQWHRLLGLCAAGFVLLLASTGLVLNHSHELALDRSHVSAAALLDWYGIQAPTQGLALMLGGRQVAQLGKRLYVDQRQLPGSYGRLLGAVASAPLLVLAVEGELVLLSPAGELVERLGSAQGLPAGIQALGHTPDGQVAVRAGHGVYVADRDILRWQPRPQTLIQWSRPQTLDAIGDLELARRYRETELTHERVLLDIHSGRIAGRFGVWLMDVMALLFLLLATTGVWLWAKRKR